MADCILLLYLVSADVVGKQSRGPLTESREKFLFLLLLLKLNLLEKEECGDVVIGEESGLQKGREGGSTAGGRCQGYAGGEKATVLPL